MGSSSWQRTLGPRPCPQNSKCTAEQSAGCRRPPWRERTTWRNVSGPSPSTECRTRWGRQTLTSWHTWCSRPEEERGQLFDLNKCKTRLSCLWSVCVLSWDVFGWSFYSFKKKKLTRVSSWNSRLGKRTTFTTNTTVRELPIHNNSVSSCRNMK